MSVPALEVQGKKIITSGTIVRIAAVHDEEWLETDLSEPEVCVRELKRQNAGMPSADIFTFAQKPPAAFPRYDYPMELESIAAAETTSFAKWWESLPQETRKNVRRSRKRGVVVDVRPFDDELIAGIAAVNNESPVRQGKANKHYGKSPDLVRKDHESFVERSEFVCAFVDRELVGYLKIVYRGDVASILNIVSKTCHQDKRPSNALLAKAIELCEGKGISLLIYGRYYYGNKRHSPLLDFKIRHGFREIQIPRYYVPLTGWGALSLRLKLHRDLLGVLPPSIIEMCARARARWHAARNRWAGVAQW